MQIRMSEVSTLVRGNSTPDNSDYAASIGKTLLDNLVNHVVTTGFSPGASANPVEQLQTTLSVAKDLAGINETREKRLMEENESLRSNNKELHEVKMHTGMGDMAKMLEVLIPVIKGEGTSKDDMYAMILDMNNKHHEQQIALMKELMVKEKSNDDDLLRKIGTEAIMSRLNSDPREEFDRQRDYWSKVLNVERHNNENIVNFEKWKVQKNIELEEKKIDLEVKKQESLETKEEKAAERQNRMIENLAIAVTGIASKGGSTQDEVNQALSQGMYLVKCPNCNDEFVLTQAKEHINCPFCKAELTTGQQTA